MFDFLKSSKKDKKSCKTLVEQRKKAAKDLEIACKARYLAKNEGSRTDEKRLGTWQRQMNYVYKDDKICIEYFVEDVHRGRRKEIEIYSDGERVFHYKKDTGRTYFSESPVEMFKPGEGEWLYHFKDKWDSAKQEERKKERKRRKKELEKKWGIDADDCELDIGACCD